MSPIKLRPHPSDLNQPQCLKALSPAVTVGLGLQDILYGGHSSVHRFAEVHSQKEIMIKGEGDERDSRHREMSCDAYSDVLESDTEKRQ